MKEAENLLNNVNLHKNSYDRVLNMLNQDTKFINIHSSKKFLKRELIEHINNCGQTLAEFNKVMLISENCYEWAVVFFTCLVTGKKLYALDPNSNNTYYEKMADVIAPDIIIYSSNYKGTINESCMSIHNIIKQHFQPKTICYSEGSIILFTTGTTGISKGVELKCEQILENAYSLENVIKFDSTDTILLFSPFYRAMGMIMLVWGAFWGGTCILTNNQVDLIRALIKYSPSVLNFPPVYLGILKKSDKYVECMKRSKAVIVGSAGISSEIWEYYEKNKIRIYNGYGMTECVSAIAISDYSKKGSPKYVYPLSCCKIKLSAYNEIMVKGITVSKRYVDGNAIVDNEGWYHTGDIGIFHGEQLEVVGRLDTVKVLKSGIKLDLASIKKRILTDEYILACELYIEKNYDDEILCANVIVKKNVFCTAYDIQNRINAILDKFEQIKKITYSEE